MKNWKRNVQNFASASPGLCHQNNNVLVKIRKQN